MKANNDFGSSPARIMAIIVNDLPAQPTYFSTVSENVCSNQNAVVYTIPAVSTAMSYT